MRYTGLPGVKNRSAGEARSLLIEKASKRECSVPDMTHASLPEQPANGGAR